MSDALARDAASIWPTPPYAKDEVRSDPPPSPVSKDLHKWIQSLKTHLFQMVFREGILSPYLVCGVAVPDDKFTVLWGAN